MATKTETQMSFDSVNSERSTINMPGQLPMLNGNNRIDHNKCRYPHCIVWTPIPCITWLFPFIGHMGIATTSGVIRDFAGPYFVSVCNWKHSILIYVKIQNATFLLTRMIDKKINLASALP
ncbi:uncharacterized protein LOC124121780 [Haliotis rufescens]|uniref:uncharacterized protein LOC124121780 n=1 Tax=Haliotis rufescens TaxID=6454 RepID=UPI001EB046CD|nr:uncharacterized protein LOC124121780 [Haliotis rufescens]